MKSQPITPARIEFGEVPAAPDFGDVYHPHVGALAQARHVFLRGNGLPERWRGRDRFVMLETGFGLGNNFIAAWDAWRSDAARCRQLVFASIERPPPTHADLVRAHAASTLPALAGALASAWPPLVHGLHTIDFEHGRVRLLLAFGDVAAWLPELALQADAILLDGFAPARNPAMWEAHVLKAVGRRAAPGATAATWSVARELREGLASAGFEVGRAPGIGGKREITVARHAPRFTPPGPPAPTQREAAVIGAGLAGAAIARALADEGWEVTVLDRQPAPALETSGNAGGLFHGTVHADDGPHARWLRAAALHAQRTIAPLVAAGLPGQVQGLLRLGGRDGDGLRRLVERQHLPADWVQVLDPAAASALAGVPIAEASWCFPGGGWVSPAALARHWLDGLRLRGGVAVDRLERADSAWRLLDADGRTLHTTPVVVLANAADALRLAAPFGYSAPVRRVRGQVTAWRDGATALARPIAGDGYALPLPGGGLLCGATSQPGDEDPALRDADHQHNLQRLQRLTGLARPAGAALEGRVGWRLQTDDRLPIAGALPDLRAHADGARRWPRIEGLWLGTALGGRGITLAPLLGRLVAAQIAHAPLPLERSLVDAVDPARWALRVARRATNL